eukprot:s2107_g5.t1
MLASENPTLELAGPLHRDKTVDPRPWLCFKRHIAVDVGVPATRTQAEFSGAQLQSWLEGRFELAVHPKVTSAPLGLQAIYLRTAKGVEPLGWLCENRAEHLCNVGLGSSLGLYPGTVKSRHTRLFSAFRNCSRSPWMSTTFEALFGMVVVMVMLRLELFRRAVNGRPGDTAPSADKYKKLLRECAPEAIGTLACVLLVVALRSRGDTIGESMDERSREAWEAIKAQWPVLMTADTLLALQVMLRLIVVLSAVLRSGSGTASPLLDECAVMWFGGAAARSAVLMHSKAYWLEGPVGGLIPTISEVLLAPLLFVLGKRALRRSTLTMSLVVVLVGFFAQRNNIHLAEEQEANLLFTAAHCFELLSAVLYLGRTLLSDSDSPDLQFSLTFTHLVMVVQQSLAVYFWLQAFEPDTVSGTGLGIAAIQLSCLGQLCAYLAAASLHVATWFADEAYQPIHAHL